MNVRGNPVLPLLRRYSAPTGFDLRGKSRPQQKLPQLRIPPPQLRCIERPVELHRFRLPRPRFAFVGSHSSPG